MKLTEAKIREAQAVIEAVMAELDIDIVLTYSKQYKHRIIVLKDDSNAKRGDSLADIYINHLHELNGTQAPPF